jgi:hypothetical protein
MSHTDSFDSSVSGYTLLNMLIDIYRRSAATQGRQGLQNIGWGKDYTLLYMQTESSDARPSSLKSIGGETIRLIYCFICRRRAATQDRPGASPLPLHLFSYADVCCCTLAYAAV